MTDWSPALSVALAVWVALEVVLVLRDLAQSRGSQGHDRGTRALNGVALYGAFLFALWSHSVVSSEIPGPHEAGGLIVICLGLAIRIWSVAVLGRAFRTTVDVDTEQPVVSDGPYRWVRHPSYTGLLLIVAGFGLAIGNWLGLIACLGLPLLALRVRMRVEEAELERVLGEPYRAYEARTKRLIPGVW